VIFLLAGRSQRAREQARERGREANRVPAMARHAGTRALDACHQRRHAGCWIGERRSWPGGCRILDGAGSNKRAALPPQPTAPAPAPAG